MSLVDALGLPVLCGVPIAILQKSSMSSPVYGVKCFLATHSLSGSMSDPGRNDAIGGK